MIKQLLLYEPRHEKTCFFSMQNKDADQLCGSRETDQRLCLNYTIQNFKSLTIFWSCTDRFVSDLVANTEDIFSRDAAPKIN